MDTAKINFGQNTTNVEVTAKTDAAAQKHLQELMKNMRKADFDSFQKSAITTSEACGCYPNYQITTGMPKSVFADQFGYEMQKEIASHMRDYYSGKVSDDERNEYFNQCCADMRNYCIKQCRTTGTNEAANKQIIGQVYEIFAKENQRAARNANYEEGKAVNDSLANKYRDDDWVYYNSDYYYECEQVHSDLAELADNMADKWGTEKIDVEEIEKNSGFTLDGGFDFNSGWNFSYRNQTGRGSMTDESMIPPENFKFFYKESISPNADNIGDALKGSASVSIGDKKYSTDIPFSISHDDLSGQIFKADDLFSDAVADNKELKDFLSNFSVFTRAYAYSTGINNIFGNLIPQYK